MNGYGNMAVLGGNPGAMTFYAEAHNLCVYRGFVLSFAAQKAFDRMLENGITGDKLYMLWNDCCDRDTGKALKIIMDHDIDDIVEHINYENGRGIKYDTDEKFTIEDAAQEFGDWWKSTKDKCTRSLNRKN